MRVVSGDEKSHIRASQVALAFTFITTNVVHLTITRDHHFAIIIIIILHSCMLRPRPSQHQVSRRGSWFVLARCSLIKDQSDRRRISNSAGLQTSEPQLLHHHRPLRH